MILTFRKPLILAGALALLAGPALAQPMPPQGPPHNQYPGQNYAQHPPGPPPPPHGAPPAPPPHEAYGPPHGGWHEGDHYNGNRMVVHNWDHYHLHEPPPGYEWVQSGDQFVMIAVTSGIIASIIASSAAQ